MYLRKVGKQWQVQVYAGTVKGRKTYRYATRRTKDEARTAGDDLRLEIRRGAAVADDASLGELLDRWFVHARAVGSPKRPGPWSASTVNETRYIIQRIKRHDLAEMVVAEIRTRHLDAYYTHLRAEGGRGGAPLAGGTVARIHSVMSAALAQAVRWDLTIANPATEAAPGGSGPNEIVPPDDDAVQRLVEIADPTFAAFLVLAATTGARRGELLGLKWQDIGDAALHVRRTVVTARGGLEVKPYPKSQRSRRLRIDADTRSVLTDHRRRCAEAALACGVPLPDYAYVFAQEPDGRDPWHPSTATHRFIAYRRAAGVDDTIRLHDLRHYAASVLIGAGVDIAVVSHRLGHARTSTTLDIYTHLIEANDQAAADVAGRIVHKRSS